MIKFSNEMIRFIRKIYNADVEIMGVFSQLGEMLGESIGGSKFCRIPVSAYNRITIHNHPVTDNQTMTFSLGDIELSLEREEHTSIVVTPEKVFVLWCGDVEPDMYRLYDLWDVAEEYADEKGYPVCNIFTQEDLCNLMNINAEFRHIVTERLVDLIGINYVALDTPTLIGL